jgi:hypothetical protein
MLVPPWAPESAKGEARIVTFHPAPGAVLVTVSVIVPVLV